MCGRYSLTYADLGAVVAELGALLDPAAAELYRPRYNVAPTNTVVIGRAGPDGETRPVLVPGVWGLHRGPRLIINVRSENAAARFPAAYRSGRCVVPADGFFEWTGEKKDRRATWFHAPDGAPLFMAGLLDEHASTGAPPTFAVLTTAARPPVAAVHDRMPVLLSRDAALDWLRGDAPRLVPLEAVPLAARAVGAHVNAAANDDPACLLPANDANDANARVHGGASAPAQLGLFAPIGSTHAAGDGLTKPRRPRRGGAR
jgi:putative SOS response-associated peptidase YedK